MHERSGGAAGAQEIDDHIEHLRVQDGGSLEIFSGGGGAGEDENSRADDGADAERGQRPGAQRFAAAGVPGSSDSEISLSIDLQQKSWLSEVRMTSAGSVVGCDKRLWFS